MTLQHNLRGCVASLTRRLPPVRGLGRCVLAVDKWLTDANDPASYEIAANVNGNNRLILDLRSWEQKFAFYYGTYEPDFIDVTRRLFRGGIFYDIGASIGIFSVTMANICREQQAGEQPSHVRAFEPVPANLRRLEAQITENDFDDDLIRVEKIALSDAPGTAMMDLCDGGKPGNAKITSSGEVSVEVTLLDKVWAERDREPVEFVKIDTEGWDAKIIAGGREMIRTCRPNLLIEFNRERMTNHHIPIDSAWQFLTREMQYHVFRIDEHTRRPVELSDPGDHENLFFVRTADVDRINV